MNTFSIQTADTWPEAFQQDIALMRRETEESGDFFDHAITAVERALTLWHEEERLVERRRQRLVRELAELDEVIKKAVVTRLRTQAEGQSDPNKRSVWLAQADTIDYHSDPEDILQW